MSASLVTAVEAGGSQAQEYSFHAQIHAFALVTTSICFDTGLARSGSIIGCTTDDDFAEPLTIPGADRPAGSAAGPIQIK